MRTVAPTHGSRQADEDWRMTGCPVPGFVISTPTEPLVQHQRRGTGGTTAEWMRHSIPEGEAWEPLLPPL